MKNKYDPFEYESYDSDDVKRKNEVEIITVGIAFFSTWSLFGGIIMQSKELLLVAAAGILLTLIIEIWKK